MKTGQHANSVLCTFCTGRTKTYYVREAILEQLADLEDLHIAEGTPERIRSDEQQTIPLKDVMTRHSLAG